MTRRISVLEREDCTLRRGIVPFTHLAREGRMTVTIERRELLAALGGAAVALPLGARAQQSAMPVIGFLHPGSLNERVHLVAALRAGLRAGGYIEGQNVTVDYRSAEDQFDRLPELAAELVRRHASVIVTPAGTVAALALKVGLVASFNRPGGNITGIFRAAG